MPGWTCPKPAKKTKKQCQGLLDVLEISQGKNPRRKKRNCISNHVLSLLANKCFRSTAGWLQLHLGGLSQWTRVQPASIIVSNQAPTGLPGGLLGGGGSRWQNTKSDTVTCAVAPFSQVQKPSPMRGILGTGVPWDRPVRDGGGLGGGLGGDGGLEGVELGLGGLDLLLELLDGEGAGGDGGLHLGCHWAGLRLRWDRAGGAGKTRGRLLGVWAFWGFWGFGDFLGFLGFCVI